MFFFGILFDVMASVLIQKYFRSKIAYFVCGIVGGICSSILTVLIGLIFSSEKPVYIIFNGFKFSLAHVILIYLFIFMDLRRRSKKIALIETKNIDEKWNISEKQLIKAALFKYSHINHTIINLDSEEGQNISRLTSEEILEKLSKKYFSEEATPFALAVLQTRL